MKRGRERVWAWVLAAGVAGPAVGQEWALDVPGVPGDPPDAGVNVIEMLHHPSGELVGVGGYHDGGGESRGALVRFGLDAELKGASWYPSIGGLTHSFIGACLGQDDSVVVGGYFFENLIAVPFLYGLDRQTGAVLWEQTPTSEQGAIYAVKPHGDGYLGIGTLHDESGASRDGYLVRVDGAGEVVWQRSYDVLGGRESWRDAVIRANGNILVGGMSDYQVHTVEVLPDGGLLAARSFDVPGGQALARIEPADDGGVFLAATTSLGFPLDRTVWVARLDALGGIVWQYDYRAPFSDLFTMTALSDGGVAVSGASRHGDDRSPLLLRLDAGGAVSWLRSFAQLTADASAWNTPIQELPDGGIALSVASPDYVADVWHTLLFRVGPDGGKHATCWEFGGEVAVGRTPTAITPQPQAIASSTVDPLEPDLVLLSQPLTLEADLLCGEPCPPPARYCDTTPNSIGDGARMGWLGSTSVAADDASVTAAGVPPGAMGVFVRSTARGLAPLGDGMLCVGQPGLRLGVVFADGAGLTAMPLGLGTDGPAGFEVLPGSEWHFQLWYRDAAGGPAGTNLSDGLSVRFCP